jgi:uncharacterized protein YciI
MPGSPRRLLALHYTYVADILERRPPHREAHLALVAEWEGSGRIVIAGALGDPPTGALFAFDCPESEIEKFTAADPYIANGLVASHRIEPWTVVTGPGSR